MGERENERKKRLADFGNGGGERMNGGGDILERRRELVGDGRGGES